MTSRRVEDVHTELLRKLLSDSRLVCLRSPRISSESSISSGTAEEEGPTVEEEEAKPETVVEEEAKLIIEEEVQETLPEVFPTPSLRLVLPDKVRNIAKQNRIYVLPEQFKTVIDPQAIPKILYTPQQKYIEILGDLVGCQKYRVSLAEFWFLDTMANLLRRAQEDELDRPTQAVLMLWFCEWIKEMQNFDAADRKRMMKRFEDNMLVAAKFVAKNGYLPTPAQVGVFYEATEQTEPREKVVNAMKLEDSKHLVTFEGTMFECCLRDLTKIIHYIFDLFSTDYQYDLVRSIFTFTPEYTLIDGPYQIQNPKRLYVPLKAKVVKKTEKSPKKDVKPVKGKKKEDTDEYLALMELKHKEEKELEEMEEMDREIWNRRSHILPLSFAATDEFFNKYWPPPPPDPEPEPTPDSKGKAKKGKKN